MLPWRRGLEIALLGSCKGAKLIARIPPHLGYGPHGTPDVPANSTIRFELEVVDVSDAKQPNMFGKSMSAYYYKLASALIPRAFPVSYWPSYAIAACRRP